MKPHSIQTLINWTPRAFVKSNQVNESQQPSTLNITITNEGEKNVYMTHHL